MVFLSALDMLGKCADISERSGDLFSKVSEVSQTGGFFREITGFTEPLNKMEI